MLTLQGTSECFCNATRSVQWTQLQELSEWSHIGQCLLLLLLPHAPGTWRMAFIKHELLQLWSLWTGTCDKSSSFDQGQFDSFWSALSLRGEGVVSNVVLEKIAQWKPGGFSIHLCWKPDCLFSLFNPLLHVHMGLTASTKSSSWMCEIASVHIFVILLDSVPWRVVERVDEILHELRIRGDQFLTVDGVQNS